MVKEIIIDDVNVCKCSWCDFEPNAEPYCRINDGEDLNCEENPNCYFKQLKRTEQKLEKIKEMLEINIEQTKIYPLKNNLIKILQIIEDGDIFEKYI